MKLLIVDDSQLFQKMLVSIFSQVSHVEPLICSTLSDGLKLLNGSAVEFICVSMYQEDGDGISFTKKIRQIEKYRYVPIILFTSEESGAIYKDALSSGVTEVFHKNKLEQLTNFIERFSLRLQSISGRILYIEDTLSQRMMTKQLFQSYGLDVDDFSNAEDAWHSFERYEYDLVVTDIVLGKNMSGLTLTNKIRRQEGSKGDIPVLALTAFDDITRRIDLFYLGANDYVLKPLIEDELLARVRNLIKNKKYQDQLEILRRKAESADKAKSEFLSTMSHEIRTPMNGVLGMASLLKDTSPTEEQQEYIDGILNSGEAMLSVINAVLDFSKLESHKIELEETDFNIDKLVANTVQIFRSQAEAKGIEIESNLYKELEDVYLGDSGRIRQILMNLIANAIKFTSNGKVTITVSLEKVVADKRLIRFSVKDTGIGIPDDKMEFLFESFVQVDASTTRKYGGTGLGLAISKKLTTIMGGSIGAESRQGEGSTFWFILPLIYVGEDIPHEPDSQTEPENKSAHSPLKPLRTLIAEDVVPNQLIARKFIEKLGHRVDVVANGIEAVEAVKSRNYDIVFMDVRMPEMDGLTATSIIRNLKEEKLRNIPIIAMTANASKADMDECMVLGMDAFISKPIDRAKLKEVIGKISEKFNH